MKKRLRDAWVADLRSGKFAQATGLLHKTEATGRGRTDRAGYCCLGVLSCRIAGLAAVKETGWKWDGQQWRRDREADELVGTVEDGVLPVIVQSAVGLSSNAFGQLIEMNDGSEETRPRSFAQIAKWIEKNIEVEE